MSLGHALFSAGVVGASLLVGLLRTLGAGATGVLGTFAGLLLAVALALALLPAARGRAEAAPRTSLLHVPRPLLVLGALVGRLGAPEKRGSAVSAVTTLAYGGFLLGPAAVGLAAGAASLPAALAGVAVVSALLAAGARFAPVSARA